MKKLYLFLSASLLFSTQLSHAIIHEITRWYHSKLQQEVNILKDVHLDAEDTQETHTQRLDIIAREDLAFRIVEDSSAIAKNPEEIRQFIISKFKKFGNKHIITAKNMASCNPDDYQPNQYKKSVAASPMSTLHLLNDTYNAECRYNAEAIRNALDEISTYDDAPMLNTYYKKILSQKEFSQKQHLDSNAHYQLVNARILHTLYNNPDKKIIDIVVGKSHGNAIEPLITQLGYIKQETIGFDYINDFDRIQNIFPLLWKVIQVKLLGIPMKFIIPVVDIKQALATPLAPIRAKL